MVLIILWALCSWHPGNSCGRRRRCQGWMSPGRAVKEKDAGTRCGLLGNRESRLAVFWWLLNWEPLLLRRKTWQKALFHMNRVSRTVSGGKKQAEVGLCLGEGLAEKQGCHLSPPSRHLAETGLPMVHGLFWNLNHKKQLWSILLRYPISSFSWAPKNRVSCPARWCHRVCGVVRAGGLLSC